LAVKRFLLFVLAALLCVSNSFAGPAKPKKHDLRREIFELEDAWRNAVLKSDTNALGALLADDYMAISATGMLQTKQEALASLRTHRVHIDTLLLSDRKVRFYGKTALVTSLAEIQGTTLDGAISGSYRYTRVYVLDAQGKWKIVNFESSKLRQPDDRHEHKKQEESPNAQ
jgi:Ketosteroid isomerase homolog